jgi:hypothetical protein
MPKLDYASDGVWQKAKIDALVMNRPTLSDPCHDVIVHLKMSVAHNDKAIPKASQGVAISI